MKSSGIEVEMDKNDPQDLHISVNTLSNSSTRLRHTHKSALGNLTVSDDPTLANPSSALYFGQKETKVFTLGQAQVVLEKEIGGTEVTAKQIDEGTPGLSLIRATYTLIAFLMSGFLFVFCVQLILFLFLGLTAEFGLTGTDDSFTFLVFVGTLFAIPAYLYGMANMMTIAMAFTVDTWNGQIFMKTIMSSDSVFMDWLSTTVYVFVPFVVGAISLYSGSQDWWDTTLISWFTCVFMFFIFFCVCTIYHEIDGCLQLIRYSPKSKEIFDEGVGRFSMQTIKAAFLMKMKYMLAGTKTVHYNAYGNDPKPGEQSVEELKAQKETNAFQQSKGPLARLTVLMARWGLYEILAEPIRYYSIDEVRGQVTFVTNSTWGLEAMYCRNRQKRFVAVVEGESAMTTSQVLSSFICYLIGIVFTLFVFVAFMVWFALPPGAIGVVCGMYILWCYQSVRSSVGLRKVYNKLIENKNDTNEAEILFQVSESFRITEPTNFLCWMVLFNEFVFLFILPIGALFYAGNVPVGSLFIIVSLITCARRYCNSTIAVQEYGTLDGIELDNTVRDQSAVAKDEEWREKNRLGLILSQISSGRKNDFWMSVFIFFIITICAIFMSAVYVGANDGKEQGLSFTDKFHYPGSGNLEYTSCQLGGGIFPPASTDNSLADFALLSSAAYLAPDVANTTLKEWFAEVGITTKVEEDIVAEFRDGYEKANGKSPVEYKFFGFPDANGGEGVGVVSIRGTSNGWDALSDAQLWSAAALGQWIRAIMPLGSLFTPILQYLVEIVSVIESGHLDSVAFYKQTSAFVKHVNDPKYDDALGGKYAHIMITGHSLGGGLAMISGAQQKVPAVALSGPNAVLSRRTFSPQFSKEDLEMYTFNIVPDRDMVPRLDDLSQNYQRINCRTGLNDPISCHFAARSICEILFSCGSNGRPIPCECTTLESIYKEALEPNSGVTTTIESECPVN